MTKLIFVLMSTKSMCRNNQKVIFALHNNLVALYSCRRATTTVTSKDHIVFVDGMPQTSSSVDEAPGFTAKNGVKVLLVKGEIGKQEVFFFSLK